jgi:sarcosine oxidase, subunit gamma
VAKNSQIRIRIEEAEPLARFILHTSGDATAAASTALGFPLPDQPCRASRSGHRAALWLGPDEWLLLIPPGERSALVGTMTTRLADLPHALVEVSARDHGLIVTGDHVEDVLSAGCPLDLDATAFPIGMCARTLLGKAQIVLWRLDAEVFHIEVARSFAPYLRDFLTQAARDMD